MADLAAPAGAADPATSALLLVLSFGFVLLNGFFVASEFAIVKVRGTRIDELVTAGNFRARIARTIVTRLDAYLAACQVGITLTSIGLGWIGEPTLAAMLKPYAQRMGIESDTAVHGAASSIVAFAVISFLHIVIGEQGPKAWAIQDAERMTLLVAVPLRAFYILLYPGIWLTNGAANLMLRCFGIQPATEKDLAYSPEELGMIIETSAKAGLLNETERALLENAINLSERRVREVMIPRPDIVYLMTKNTLEQNLAIIREQQHTRYPLASKDRETVIGMIHTKDLTDAIVRGEPEISLERIARPITFVPEVAPLDRVLKTFQRTGTHLAIVVDEYGGVAGLVTLEDVLEMLVGPIRDEFDAAEESGITVRPGADSEVDAGLALDDVAKTFKFEPVQANVETIGGYVLQLLGRLPKVGEHVVVGRWRVEVAEMHGLRVTRLRFKPRDEPKGARPPTPAQGPPAPA